MSRHRRSMPRWCYCAGAQVLLFFALGCEQAPAEPEPAPRPVRSAPRVAPLSWTVPASWNVERVAEQGQYRGKYTVAASGDAKHEANALVSRLPAKESDVTAQLDAFVKEFEGPGAAAPKREQFKVGAFDVTMIEVAATYRFPMGPPMGPNKKRAAHVLKDNWRGIAYAVVTPARGTYLFRLVGPSDTVEATRSAFRSMIDSVK